jgi:STE24 endopeptidase
MSTSAMLTLYLSFLAAETIIYRGLDILNLRRLTRFGHSAPPPVNEYMRDDEYRNSVLYSLDRQRFAFVTGLVQSLLIAVLVIYALPGRIEVLVSGIAAGSILGGTLLVLLTGALFGVVDTIFSAWSQFVIEQRHGFNRMGVGLFLADLLKGLFLGLALGVPLLILLLWSVESLGRSWWIWGFAAVAAFQLLLAFLFPVMIAPLFYRFTPLEEGPLKERILALARKTGFTLKAIQVMDGSRRSAHSNAFFTGFGSNKRIALFDTLMDSMTDEQIEAVVAHELGHAKLKHTVKQLASSMIILFGLFALLALLLNWEPLYRLFGFRGSGAAALLVIMLYFSSPLTFWFSPLGSILSRRREYAADAYARDICGSYRPLAEGLMVLHRENRSNPVPHPWYSFVHYGHPTVWERVQAMKQGAAEEN